ncbi:MAG: peptidylprolyl isomerase [Candidatus Woesearchaeota archaeon]
MKWIHIGSVCIALFLLAGCSTTPPEEPQTEQNPIVVLQTNHGDIVIELYMDIMPITAGNFYNLTRQGFYDDVVFHRVIDGFMIQGGDPTGTGTGGPGYTIEDEFIENERTSNVRGTISMANTGRPNSGGSQFFINVADNTNLDWDRSPMQIKHPVFGVVVEGMDVVDAISQLPTDMADRPIEPLIMERVYIRE